MRFPCFPFGRADRPCHCWTLGAPEFPPTATNRTVDLFEKRARLNRQLSQRGEGGLRKERTPPSDPGLPFAFSFAVSASFALSGHLSPSSIPIEPGGRNRGGVLFERPAVGGRPPRELPKLSPLYGAGANGRPGTRRPRCFVAALGVGVAWVMSCSGVNACSRDCTRRRRVLFWAHVRAH